MKRHHIMQGLVTALLVCLIVVLESISAAGAYHAESDPFRGAQMAALTIICAAIAFIGFGLAGRLKEDERPVIRRRAKTARVVALSFLFLGPIPFFGSALKMERLDREWAAYIASPLYAADQAFVADPQNLVGYSGVEQQNRLVQPTSANLTPFDVELYVALLLQLLMIFASDALRVPAPITQDERQALMFKMRGQKAAATRKRRKQAKEARKTLKVV